MLVLLGHIASIWWKIFACTLTTQNLNILANIFSSHEKKRLEQFTKTNRTHRRIESVYEQTKQFMQMKTNQLFTNTCTNTAIEISIRCKIYTTNGRHCSTNVWWFSFSLARPLAHSLVSLEIPFHYESVRSFRILSIRNKHTGREHQNENEKVKQNTKSSI